MFINIILKLLLVTIGYRNILFPENNASFIYYFNLLFLHDE